MEAIRLSDKILLLEADPGHIVKEFEFEVEIHSRDDAFVYNETAKILQDKTIIDTFELYGLELK
jgi:NitT/TauT family transport system ATP-binding protein